MSTCQGNGLAVQQLPAAESRVRPIDWPMGRGALCSCLWGPAKASGIGTGRYSLAPRLPFHLEVLCFWDSLQLLGNCQASRHPDSIQAFVPVVGFFVFEFKYFALCLEE